MFHVSERTHAGLLLMTSLATHASADAFVSLQTIAREHKLSQGYLEEIAGILRRHGLIEGKQGPHGGYRLHGLPSSICLADITEAIEGELSLVDCQKKDAVCPIENACSSKSVWQGLRTTIQTYLQQTSLTDIIEKRPYVR